MCSLPLSDRKRNGILRPCSYFPVLGGAWAIWSLEEAPGSPGTHSDISLQSLTGTCHPECKRWLSTLEGQLSRLLFVGRRVNDSHTGTHGNSESGSRHLPAAMRVVRVLGQGGQWTVPTLACISFSAWTPLLFVSVLVLSFQDQLNDALGVTDVERVAISLPSRMGPQWG